MLKKSACFLLTAILLLMLLSGCGRPEKTPEVPGSAAASDPETFPYTFTDSLGNTVTLEHRPQRVAALFSSLADIWVTAGGTLSVTVGEAVERGFASGDVTLVDDGSGHAELDLETLVSAEPELVIGTADYDSQVTAVDFCREQGIPAACFRVESFSDYLTVLKIFCDLTGEPERYETYGTALSAEIDGLLEAAARTEPAYPRILFIRSGSSASSAKAKTAREHFACAMLDELGTVNIADTEQVLLDTLSTEVILREDPDYIFITTMGDGDAARAYVEELFAGPGWSELTAVQNGAYAFLPKELFQFKPNARWTEAYRYLFDILYPEQAGV